MGNYNILNLGILLKNYEVQSIRDEIAGNLVYLECENNEKLISFYQRNGFVRFGERFSNSENTTYIQLLRFL